MHRIPNAKAHQLCRLQGLEGAPFPAGILSEKEVYPLMARIYRVAADMSEKEKAVGGILTFGQAGWIVCGLVVGAAVFVGLSRIMPAAIALTIGLIPGGAIAIPFAFYNKGGLTLVQYLMWLFKFQKKSKALVNTMTYRMDRAADYEREQRAKELEGF